MSSSNLHKAEIEEAAGQLLRAIGSADLANLEPRDRDILVQFQQEWSPNLDNLDPDQLKVLREMVMAMRRRYLELLDRRSLGHSEPAAQEPADEGPARGRWEDWVPSWLGPRYPFLGPLSNALQLGDVQDLLVRLADDNRGRLRNTLQPMLRERLRRGIDMIPEWTGVTGALRMSYAIHTTLVWMGVTGAILSLCPRVIPTIEPEWYNTFGELRPIDLPPQVRQTTLATHIHILTDVCVPYYQTASAPRARELSLAAGHMNDSASEAHEFVEEQLARRRDARSTFKALRGKIASSRDALPCDWRRCWWSFRSPSPCRLTLAVSHSDCSSGVAAHLWKLKPMITHALQDQVDGSNRAQEAASKIMHGLLLAQDGLGEPQPPGCHLYAKHATKTQYYRFIHSVLHEIPAFGDLVLGSEAWRLLWGVDQRGSIIKDEAVEGHVSQARSAVQGVYEALRVWASDAGADATAWDRRVQSMAEQLHQGQDVEEALEAMMSLCDSSLASLEAEESKLEAELGTRFSRNTGPLGGFVGRQMDKMRVRRGRLQSHWRKAARAASDRVPVVMSWARQRWASIPGW